MKIKFTSLYLGLLSCAVISASASKLSPTAKKLEANLKAKGSISNAIKNASFKRINEVKYLSSIIKVNEKFDFKKAESLGVKFGLKTENICTAQIPLDNYLSFIELDGLNYVQADDIAAPNLDSAISASNLKPVYLGSEGLPKAYSGKGVVIGVIDAGFDYTHPAFYDSLNKHLIIKRVWEQKKDGTPPSGFSYGRELKNDVEILAAEKDIVDFTHGTHVAAITAGQAWASNGLYPGIAQDAELVIVALKPPAPNQWYSSTGADFIDGIKYIFDYAQSQGKPAIVNLSWGGSMGPHDGTSLFSQALDKLVGEGKIFAASAGNSGQDRLHINYNFSETDTAFKTYATYSQYIPTAERKHIWFDAWGETNKNFSIDFGVLDSVNKNSIAQTSFIPTSKDTVYEFQFILPHDDTCKIEIYATHSEYNGKPHIFIDASSKNSHYFSINCKSQSGTVNLWNWYLIDYYGLETNFVKLTDTKAISGNSNSTISDFVSGASAIGVGAYATKVSYYDENNKKSSYPGTLKTIAAFSSLGPTADGRIKPDICAPGLALSSAVSSFDNSVAIGGSSAGYVVKRVDYNGKKYPYAIFQGTSMSSPALSGSIALLLEADPKLTPQKAIQILQKTAKVDTYTSTVVPNNKWGGGKLNVLDAIKETLGIFSVPSDEADAKSLVYPNPAKESIKLVLEGYGKAEAILVNSLGQIVFSKDFDLSLPHINGLSDISDGVYSLIIKQNGKILLKSELCIQK